MASTAVHHAPRYEVQERFGEWQVWMRNAKGDKPGSPQWTTIAVCDEQVYAELIVSALEECENGR